MQKNYSYNPNCARIWFLSVIMILCDHDFAHDACRFLSHLLPTCDGGRLGWGWTSWTFPPP